jgi:hypothetical protein
MIIARRCFTTLLSLLLVATALAATPARPPNIIFFLSDDLAQGDVGAYGQKLIQTPRLDRMAREGTRYTQAFCGTTVCAPSRASLLTGLHTGHSPVRGNWEVTGEGQLPLPEKTVTVAQILKTAGYATAVAGKWGMGMFDTTGSPLKKRLRPPVRLQLPAPRPLVFPRVPLQRRPPLRPPRQHRQGRRPPLRAKSHPGRRAPMGPHEKRPALLPLLRHHAPARHPRDR